MVIERPSDELNNYFIRNDYKITGKTKGILSIYIEALMIKLININDFYSA